MADAWKGFSSTAEFPVSLCPLECVGPDGGGSGGGGGGVGGGCPVPVRASHALGVSPSHRSASRAHPSSSQHPAQRRRKPLYQRSMSYDASLLNGDGVTVGPVLRETGCVEKLMQSYGFVKCYERQARLFFHYSQFRGHVQDLKVGDDVEFEVSTDRKTGKPIAVNLLKVVAAIPSVGGKEGCGVGALHKGSVCYERNGEVFYLNFSCDDVEDAIDMEVGDKVSFTVATNKPVGSSGFMSASGVKLMERKRPDRFQGVVCAMKETFGFIERGDQVKEIFFHYSEYKGNLETLQPGDDVEFSIQDRNNKEVATDIRLLPEGTVIFEDISIERFKGEVLCVLPKAPSKNLSDPLPGRIHMEFPTARDLPYGEKDTRTKVTLLPGDQVEFSISTDRRDGLERATTITLMSETFTASDEKREVGVVAALRDGFGFIKCVEREQRMFFHYSEVMDDPQALRISDEVEFTVIPVRTGERAGGQDAMLPQRNHAVRIRRLPKGSVSFSTRLDERYVGVVEREAIGAAPSPSKAKEKDQEPGIIAYEEEEEGEKMTISYLCKDVEGRGAPKVGDKVEFSIAEVKRSGQRSAACVRVLSRLTSGGLGNSSSGGAGVTISGGGGGGGGGKRQVGFIATLKDNFGFIENIQHNAEIFFHYSEYNGDVDLLEVGDAVEYSLSKTKANKTSADKVSKITSGNVPKDDVQPTIYLGKVARPLRSVDPQQAEYQGLVEVTEDCALKGDTFPYGVVGLASRCEYLQKGENVKFQLCTVTATGGALMACNITPMRKLERAYIDSVKSEFGFIAYEVGDSKKLFFHVSEVLDGLELMPNDEVEFHVVFNPRTSKSSACNVRRIGEASKMTPSPRPERLVSRLKSLTLDDNSAPRLTVTRQPRGPDSTKGFTVERVLRQVGVAE
ncbi:cold shock domain-containing protein E1-like isoform X7 [Lethenteron reissneri]|uniref:cold shock domain-containing protein E1-like isoform X7 n=1 Tax=Lethenteron reissneri TaxID=7753 RepID=UPI002AB778D4|nr:cold shock domain-containing protein E1-like isoform X7 [Lethenteron reissneri]XP_061435049.1 cold shock domain-containing protein E1-like isoform X7 [Lethenteron reissneri]